MPLKFKLGSVIKHFKYVQSNFQIFKCYQKASLKIWTRKSDSKSTGDITGKNFIVELLEASDEEKKTITWIEKLGWVVNCKSEQIKPHIE